LNYSVQFSIILYNLYEKWELVTFLLHAFTTITGIAAITLGLRSENAIEVNEAFGVIGTILFGSEFKFEIVEETKNRVVGKVIECPY
jgi:hypothetical protein